jgi:hypothetical protein
VTLDKTLISLVDAVCFTSPLNRHANHCPDCSIHARGIPTTSHHSDPAFLTLKRRGWGLALDGNWGVWWGHSFGRYEVFSWGVGGLEEGIINRKKAQRFLLQRRGETLEVFFDLVTRLACKKKQLRRRWSEWVGNKQSFIGQAQALLIAAD